MEINLRPIKNDDLDNLVKYAGNKKIFDNLTDQFPHPFTADAGKNFINKIRKVEPHHVLAIDHEGELIGAIGVHPQADVYCKNAEMGYWVAEEFWGQGVISQAIPKMVDYGFEKFDFTRIFARPYGRNVASQKALEKSGFVLEATLEKTFYKNGRFEDELIYAIRRK